MNAKHPHLAGIDEGPVTLSTEPYISETYARDEKELLWRKVWQVACREEEIPRVGDFYTYEIHDQSIIVTRTGEDEIAAYYNACLHRGRRLTKGCGHVSHFHCPYHGWQWNLKGDNINVLDITDWDGALDDVNLSLPAVKVARWAGFVFINFDPNCAPLEEFLQKVPYWIDPFEVDKMRFKWRQWSRVACNWKVMVEAFIEGYHAGPTHPQTQRWGGGRTGSSSEGLHGRLFSVGTAGGGIGTAIGKAETKDIRNIPYLMMKQQEETVWTLTTATFVAAAKQIPDLLPETATVEEVGAKLMELARQMDAERGVAWPAVDPEHMLHVGINWHVFPNVVLLPNVTFCLGFRILPDGFDPDSCIMEVFALERYPEGEEPKTQWEHKPNLMGGDEWPLLLKQDFKNLPEVQLGMKSDAHTGLILNPKMEAVIINFERNLAAYMGRCTPQPLNKGAE